METLKEKTAKGLLWGGLNSGVQQVVGLAFGIILGRLLAPSDYGMMAMISIFSLVATALQDSGFRTALANLPNPKPEDYNSVFWFNIIVASTLYAVLFLAAPLIGEYYHTPRVVPLCRYAFLSIIIASFGTAQSAYLFKNLRAKQQAAAGGFAVIASSLVGVGMAAMGMAYWSLATQGLVYVSINTLLQWHFSPWRPSLRGVTFEPVKRMARFSCKILATTIMTCVNNNVLNILLGHYFSPRDTGYYNQAYQWNTKCFSLVQSMVAQVAQPVLVSLGNEPGRQLDVFRKMMRFTSFVTFPLLFGFGLVAPEFIELALGTKWLPSAELIHSVCVGSRHATGDIVLQHDYLEGPFRHILLVYVLSWRGPDRLDAGSLSARHTDDGHCIHAPQHLMAGSLALLRPPTDRLRLSDVPPRRPAFRHSCNGCDVGGLYADKAHREPLGAPRHKSGDSRRTLLCGDEGGKSEDSRRV